MSVRLAHIAVLLALTTLAAGIGGIAATWRIADREFRNVLDEDLANNTDLIAELVALDGFTLSGGALRDLLADVFDDDDASLWITVYDLSSDSHVSNFDHDIRYDGNEDGAVELNFAGHPWQGFREDESHYVVQVMRRADVYDDVRDEFLEDIVTPVLVGSGVNLALIGILIAFFLWPVSRLARQLESRSASSLAPLDVRTPATEVRVLRDVINELIGDVEDVLKRERRFADDVAHELRTPLTTLKIELAADPPDLPAVKAEVDRLGRLVGQLLTLARLEQGQWRQRFEPVSLDAMCARTAERFNERFAAAGMTLAVDAAPATVRGDATLLDVLVQNLLQNILEHCPAGTTASVQVSPSGTAVRLIVSDNGKGLAEGLGDQLSGDFTRLDSKGEGLGLGLAICHRIAKVHDAALAFRAHGSGAPGLVVEVTFPVGSGSPRQGA